jgi:ribosome-associated heat shock protein Hsp15
MAEPLKNHALIGVAAHNGVRVDAWVWAIRLYSTRSAATAACKAGHVKVNNSSAKPAQVVRIGDRVRALTAGGERIVEVTGLIAKRTSAPLAALRYLDHTPPPPPKEERPANVVRERGAGRPTKRDRRLMERLRDRDGEPVELE